MDSANQPVVLKGAHVIDPGQGIHGIVDIAIENGKVRSLDNLPADAQTIDLAGSYLSPGWVDIHVHIYGTLGFADPHSIGPHPRAELRAWGGGRTGSSLYAGPYLPPLGILSLNFIEGDVRTITNIPIADWLDFKKAHPGLLRYLKVGAFSGYGYGPT